jgi:hypothetical protein
MQVKRLLSILLVAVAVGACKGSPEESPKGLNLSGQWVGIDSIVTQYSESVYTSGGPVLHYFRGQTIYGFNMVLTSTSQEETYAESGNESWLFLRTDLTDGTVSTSGQGSEPFTSEAVLRNDTLYIGGAAIPPEAKITDSRIFWVFGSSVLACTNYLPQLWQNFTCAETVRYVKQ